VVGEGWQAPNHKKREGGKVNHDGQVNGSGRKDDNRSRGHILLIPTQRCIPPLDKKNHRDSRKEGEENRDITRASAQYSP